MCTILFPLLFYLLEKFIIHSHLKTPTSQDILISKSTKEREKQRVSGEVDWLDIVSFWQDLRERLDGGEGRLSGLALPWRTGKACQDSDTLGWEAREGLDPPCGTEKLSEFVYGGECQ